MRAVSGSIVCVMLFLVAGCSTDAKIKKELAPLEQRLSTLEKRAESLEKAAASCRPPVENDGKGKGKGEGGGGIKGILKNLFD